MSLNSFNTSGLRYHFSPTGQLTNASGLVFIWHVSGQAGELLYLDALVASKAVHAVSVGFAREAGALVDVCTARKKREMCLLNPTLAHTRV